ncbi:hypothetical protein [Paenibacillus sp. P36]
MSDILRLEHGLLKQVDTTFGYVYLSFGPEGVRDSKQLLLGV